MTGEFVLQQEVRLLPTAAFQVLPADIRLRPEHHNGRGEDLREDKRILLKGGLPEALVGIRLVNLPNRKHLLEHPDPAVMLDSFNVDSSAHSSPFSEVVRRCQTRCPLTGLFSSCLLLTSCGLNTIRDMSPGRSTIGSTVAESGPVCVILAFVMFTP